MMQSKEAVAMFKGLYLNLIRLQTGACATIYAFALLQFLPTDQSGWDAWAREGVWWTSTCVSAFTLLGILYYLIPLFLGAMEDAQSTDASNLSKFIRQFSGLILAIAAVDVLGLAAIVYFSHGSGGFSGLFSMLVAGTVAMLCPMNHSSIAPCPSCNSILPSLVCTPPSTLPVKTWSGADFVRWVGWRASRPARAQGLPISPHNMCVFLVCWAVFMLAVSVFAGWISARGEYEPLKLSPLTSALFAVASLFQLLYARYIGARLQMVAGQASSPDSGCAGPNTTTPQPVVCASEGGASNG